MLETSSERVKLLRAGFTEKEVEKLYLITNHIRTIPYSVLFELVEISVPENTERNVSCQAAIEKV